ncbi:hypothetical protein HM1_2333 [Heliomicrobium modesticaldum Ice1]|uniref:Uncharacterized protein n=1 Tax=Heliobacterium modesticaldum (strain ATCC 51547 / Ice1) TaxID=498761 RepID=B0THT3_HELMI|nr:hypothetical protein HM1_2333 [Heliomicrobium modesticaldum Ice1]
MPGLSELIFFGFSPSLWEGLFFGLCAEPGKASSGKTCISEAMLV